MYLMDTTGKTLAASNWDKQDSFVGRNFSFRPYFSEAMAGRLGRFFGLGTTSAKRGYFFAAAVREGDKIIGVLVVKVDLDHTESLWGNTPEQLLVTDHNGVVILTSRPQWRFRATRPLTDEERQAIIAIQPYPTRDPQPLSLSNSAGCANPRHRRDRLECGNPRAAILDQPPGAHGGCRGRRHAAGADAAARFDDATPPPLPGAHRLRSQGPSRAGNARG